MLVPRKYSPFAVYLKFVLLDKFGGISSPFKTNQATCSITTYCYKRGQKKNIYMVESEIRNRLKKTENIDFTTQ